MYLFGPLIDAPPSHPDTVLTSMLYMTKSLGELGMTYANLSIDMQLYMVGQQVKWCEPERFKNVILRPGAMYIIMPFLGCIGTPMKGSGLEVLVGAAFGGLTGIMNGKAWVRAMRAYRMVSVTLLGHYLQGSVKTFDEIAGYMEEARQHPTGRHWVDNLVMPTVSSRRERRRLALPTTLLGKDASVLLQCRPHTLCLIHHMAPAGDAPPPSTRSQG